MINLVCLNETNVKSKVKDLYLNEFPKYERYPFWLLVYKARRKNSDFYVIYDDSDYVGLLYLTYYKDIVYIFYFAIDLVHQSKGYGSQVLQHLKKMYKNERLLLNIEKVDQASGNYEQRVKRKRFYEKNGFKHTGFDIEQKEVVYEILHSGEIVYKHEYQSLFKAYLGKLLYFIL